LESGSQVSEEFPATNYMISVVEGKQAERNQTNKTQVGTEVSYIGFNGRKREPYINNVRSFPYVKRPSNEAGLTKQTPHILNLGTGSDIELYAYLLLSILVSLHHI